MIEPTNNVYQSMLLTYARWIFFSFVISDLFAVVVVVGLDCGSRAFSHIHMITIIARLFSFLFRIQFRQYTGTQTHICTSIYSRNDIMFDSNNRCIYTRAYKLRIHRVLRETRPQKKILGIFLIMCLFFFFFLVRLPSLVFYFIMIMNVY